MSDLVIPSDYNVCLQFLAIFGRNPLAVRNSQYQHKFHRPQLSLAIAALANLTVVVTWSLFFYELVLNHPQENDVFGSLFHIFHFYKDKIQDSLKTSSDLNSKTKGAITVITYLSWVLVAVQVLFAQTISWAWAPNLVTFLSNWEAFEIQFRRTCKGLSDAQLETIKKKMVPESGRRRAMVVGYVLVPTLIAIGLVAQQLLLFKHNMSTFACIFQYWFHLTLVTADLLDDARALYEINTVVRAFNLIQYGFRALAQESLANRETLEGIKSLTLSVRSQAALLGHWLAPISNQTSQDAATADGIKIMWITFPLMQVARLLVKASEAEKITGAEQHLAKELVITDLAEFDLHSMYQVQCLHDLITSSPTKVAFGTYVSFDKRLLLSVLTQVVTYEIALMQFVQI